jgi:hypothetical protein
MSILINITTPVLERKHICWNVKEELKKNRIEYVLYEVVENIYEHPLSEGMATISQVEYERINVIRENDPLIDAVKLIKWTQCNLNNLYKIEK